MNAIGLVLILAGWYQAADLAPRTANQPIRTSLTWFCVSLAGLLIAGVANAMWLLRIFVAIGPVRDVDVVPGPRVSPVAVQARGTSRGNTGLLVSGDGMSRYHRADCALAAGKRTSVAGRAAHERAGRAACAVCDP